MTGDWFDLHVWEAVVIPFLMNNCDTWTNIPAKTMETLDYLQNMFYRVALSVPAGCPMPVLYWDCSGLTMNHRKSSFAAPYCKSQIRQLTLSSQNCYFLA